jgi:hypothetical protein
MTVGTGKELPGLGPIELTDDLVDIEHAGIKNQRVAEHQGIERVSAARRL